MKLFIAIFFALLLPASAVAADTAAQATDSAKAWLALVDAGNYAQSWSETCALFQDHVTQAQWATAAKAARGPLGALISRAVAKATPANTLPGAPDGQYVVVQFHSKFANKADAVETVTMMMDGGSWKAAGYFIK
ncbi:MAG: DUF4019 domain-containing protein [Alphaproteobacteria bacterium]|nr:DUF4019 domain-containing protein [Alphaproteobacteria bacterium]MDE1985406.1 DUF4019 domain-containing protein [Alphaproteobacteria bacterium]MDE2161967.1 DUF4019 domain-containing protein [Alphaproteobacteria bacterium]MDE2264923.1 DUF4019 domain-containing protein [Alphaproteobacteria bacterium]MDE2499492.1 DUF4019 domain-containing protein [Alphaproteobacteria bacterium]